VTRLLTLNLQRGLGRDGRPTDAAALAAAFDGVSADVVALQEVDRGQPRSSGLDQAPLVAEALGLPHVRFAGTLAGDVRRAPRTSPARWGEAAGPAYGLAIASRWPVAAWFVRPLPRLRPRHPVLRRGRPALRDDEPRGALAAVLRTPDGPLSVVSTHLSLLAPVAAWQLRVLLRVARGLPGPVVVAGDLNLDPWAVGPVARGWSRPSALTFPSAGPRRQIDHVLVRGAEVTEARDVELPISDHRGLLVRLVR
jgi:endonuclease/exonuclease/phosphatase family metal-dependent hydrolase